MTGVVALVLHGGTQRSETPVDGRSASWRRMAAMQRSITPRLHEAGIATWLLRYRVRGWNGDGSGARADARWALQQVRATYGDVPKRLDRWLAFPWGLEPLREAVDQRLLLAQDVARAKWNVKAAIEDLPREEQVIAAAVRQGRGRGASGR